VDVCSAIKIHRLHPKKFLKPQRSPNEILPHHSPVVTAVVKGSP
jgi:hypothetical protein